MADSGPSSRHLALCGQTGQAGVSGPSPLETAAQAGWHPVEGARGRERREARSSARCHPAKAPIPV